MQCNKCKGEIPTSAKFCPTCGAEIDASHDVLSKPEKVWNRSLILSFVGWLFLYALVASRYQYGPLLVAFPAQSLTTSAIYLGIFGVACLGGLIYEAFGKMMPWKRIVNLTLISSIALGGLMIYGLQYAAR